MFWGVVLESGKRYSQKVSESYHLSMACLEALPGSTKPAKKEVRVMVEHGGTEFILCVLEYGRVLQEKLDIVFDCGEIVTYFLKGEGVVHLTGYALSETKDENEAVSGCTLLPALKLSNEDDDEEEEDEDWTPSKAEEDSDTSDDDSDESQDEESESGSEPELIKKDDEMDQDKLIETNEDDTDDNRGKRKKIGEKAPKSKKRKISEASPTQNGDLNGEEAKNEKRKKIEVNHVNAEDDSEDASDSEAGESQDDDDDEIDDDDSIDDSSEEEPEISSAGRTPMPNRRVTDASSLGESPALPPAQKTAPQKQKNKLKAQDVSSTNKGTVPVTPKNARKLTGNVQVEDLRIGKGPQVKSGKLVFFHYIGKFQSGKTFEKCESPEQPFSFRMGKGEVIKGLEAGLEGMNVGGKRKITIPPHMGYGSKGVEGIPPNSTLFFTVEVKAVK